MEKNGIRVFKKTGSNFDQYKKDTDYGGRTCNLAFDTDGRLASVAFDGYIRLYDAEFNLLKKKKTTGGKNPYSLTFSPDNTKLAVGYGDTATLDVLDAGNLEVICRPDNTGADTPGLQLNKLSFGADGYLYGGGLYDQSIDGRQWFLIRKWADSGRGGFLDFKAAGNTVMDIKAFQNGLVMMAGSRPDMALFDPSGNTIFYKSGEVMDFRNKDRFEFFTVSQDAGQVTFKPMGAAPLSFSIADRALKSFSKKFDSIREKREGLHVTGWKNTDSPKLNGRPLDFLDRYETCRSIDIGTDGSILVGADWSIYALDKKGNQKWRAQVPGEAWAVNIAPNNKVAVAVHDGGEIRWYRMQDGVLLLSLFVHPDRKRWILSTPQGYYDSSPGADSLMGWHINNGPEQAASFYPMSRFRSSYYRPDVVANMIEYGDGEKALEAADKGKKDKVLSIVKMVPPEVVILSPENNAVVSSDKISVRYRINTPSGEAVTGIKVLVDGRPLGAQRGIKRVKQGDVVEINVPVPPRDVILSIIAENRYAASEPTKVRLKWSGPDQFILKPKLYVLAMGSSVYENEDLRLDYPAKDAQDFAAVLRQQKGGIYRDVEVKLLNNPSRNDLMDGLEWIERQTTALDVAAVFLAGHGENDRNGNYYYLPVDTDPDSIKRTGVPYSAIKETITGLPGKVLFFLDTCHSGNVMGARRGSTGDLNKVANDLSSAENGVVVFTSSSGTQYSLENHDWGNGAFTKAVVEGLSGQADYHRDKKISISELTLFVAERVKELTQGQQTPTTCKPETIADFPIVVIQ